MENQRILIGGANLGIDLAQAESWPVLSIPALASREVVQAHAWSLLNQVYAIYSTQSSLFRILAELLLNFDHPAGIALRDAFNYSACLVKMLAGLGRGDLQLLTEGSLAFIGRGPGMTPSGDDFLAGLLAVDYQIRMDTGDQDPVWKHLVESVLAERQKRTHPLSAVLIWAAAQGSVDEALEGVIASLLAGREVRPDQVHQLAEVGHSSGLDGLAGALFRLLASPKVPNF